jgi:prepilin signal peptidase PulO-like enzyme (type II secretory pathway)
MEWFILGVLFGALVVTGASLIVNDLCERKVLNWQIVVFGVISALFTVFIGLIIEQKSYSIIILEHVSSLFLPAIFFACWRLSNGKIMGSGDVWIAYTLIFLLNWEQCWWVLLLSSCLGLLHYAIKRDPKIPLGAMLLIAAFGLLVVELFVHLF